MKLNIFFLSAQKRIFAFTAMILLSGFSYSQKPIESRGSWSCSQKKIHGKPFLISKSQNSPKHSFDVLKYTMNIDLYNCYTNPYPHSFSASLTVNFKVDSTLSFIELNAVNSSLVIDSVKLSGQTFSHINNILTINLDRIYYAGEVADVLIYYKHLDVNDNAFYSGNGFVFTDCEPEGARSWYPCWDKPSDKATLDLTAKVPDSVLLGSNGSLQDSIHIADTIFYHWVSRDPISTYLVAITSKVNYNLNIVYWHKLSNPLDSIPIRYYFNDGENISPSKNSIIEMTDLFSTLFCEHPFEKNGFASLDPQFAWGGMENQTLTSLCGNCWGENLTAHEFAHQWFGDMITCGTWANIWLNEGFGTYCESLWAEHKYGYNQYKTDIVNDANYYLANNPGWQISNPAWATITPPLSELFNFAVTYCKGSSVLHMLRYTVGDSLFFETLKSYSNDSANFKYQNAIIPDFIDRANIVCQQDLLWFFTQWLFFPNHPVYNNSFVSYDNGNTTWTVDFTANQVQSNAGFFKMPIVLKISFQDGSDTLIRVMNSVNNELFTFVFDKEPTGFLFDPNNDIVLKESWTIVDIKEKSNNLSSFNLYQNTPNPVSGKTLITIELPTDTKLKLVLYDSYAKKVAEIFNGNLTAGKHSIDFNSTGYSKGIYYYCAETGKQKLVKKMIMQ